MSRQRPVDLTDVRAYVDLTEPIIYDNIATRAEREQQALEKLKYDMECSERRVDSLLGALVSGEDPKAEILRLASDELLPRDIIARILSYESGAWTEFAWRCLTKS